MKKFQRVMSALLLIVSGVSSLAQERIDLSEADLQRLGIVFSPLQASSGGSGAMIPAQIIHAPAADTALRAYYEGVVTQWHANTGETLEEGALVATVRSQSVLDLQNTWQEALLAFEEQSFLLTKDETLFEEGIISRQRMNQTQRALMQSRNAEQAAREKLLQVGLNENDLQVLRNGEGVGQYNIRAKQTGVLSHQAVLTGGYVEAGELVGSVAGAEKWLRASLPISRAISMKQGQELRVSGINTPLTLVQLDREVDPMTQTMDILARFEGEVSLVPGQLVSLVIPPQQGGVVIPSEAVVHTGNETVVYVRGDSGVESISLSLVPLGANYLADSEVQNGIGVGTEVVVRGAAILKGIQLGLGGE